MTIYQLLCKDTVEQVQPQHIITAYTESLYVYQHEECSKIARCRQHAVY